MLTPAGVLKFQFHKVRLKVCRIAKLQVHLECFNSIRYD